MDCFISENIFDKKILNIEFSFEDSIKPIRDKARAIYEQTSPSSNHYPVHVELLAGEKEAIAESALKYSRGNDRFGNDRADLKERWATLSETEKLYKTIQFAKSHLSVLAAELDDKFLIPADSKLNYFDISNMMNISTAGYNDHGKPVSVTHFPPDESEGEKADNTIKIARINGQSLIDTYEGAWEAALYIAARVHQTALIQISDQIEIGSELNRAVRLFELSEDLIPYSCDNGQFIWNIDEFDKWISQPKYLHAFAHVQAGMKEFTLNPSRPISQEFMEGWKTEFYIGCLQYALMSNNVAFFQKNTKTSPKLDQIEKLVPLLADNIRELNASDINNIYRIMAKANQRHTVLRPQVERILRQIDKFDPFFKFLEPDTFESSPMLHKSIIKDNDAFSSIWELEKTAVAEANWSQRHIVLTKLFNLATREPQLLWGSAGIALGIEKTSVSLEDVEKLEEEKLRQLSDYIDQIQECQIAKREWKSWDKDRKCAHLLSFGNLFARIFNCDPAGQIATYQEPKELLKDGETDMSIVEGGFAYHLATDHAEDYQENYGIEVTSDRLIGINIHGDSGALDDYETALALTCHEMAHLWQADFKSDFANHKISREDPYHRLADMMLHDFSPWKSIAREENPRLSMMFYRASTNERHAFALQEKFYAIRTQQPVLSEAQILSQAGYQRIM